MKNERTSSKVASVAAKALKGPTNADAISAARKRAKVKDGQMYKEWATFLAGARWWHRKVKSALASALTQSPDKPKRGRKP